MKSKKKPHRSAARGSSACAKRPLSFCRPPSHAPVVREILLEATLRHEVHSGARQRLVARKLFGIARNRRRYIVERDEEPVDEAQREDFSDAARASETLDPEHDLSAKAMSVLVWCNCNRRYLGERRRILFECSTRDNPVALNRNYVVLDVERDLLDRSW